MYSFIAQTLPGTKKKMNEDRIFINGHILSEGEYSGFSESIQAAIFDGIGGEHGGDCAAAIAANGFLTIDNNINNSSEIIKQLININNDIHIFQNDYYYFRKMSTTIAGVYFNNNGFWHYNLGDTRIYKYANNELSLLSFDHTLANQKINSGEILSINEASKAEINTLTKFLGGRGITSRPIVRTTSIESKDTAFIICSDGIYKSFKDISDFQHIFESKTDIKAKKEAIVQHALRNGSSDDKSIIIISST